MTARIYILLFVCFAFCSCKKNETPPTAPVKKDGYTVSGNAEGLVNGLRAYLLATDEKGYLKSKDTAIIMNERFYFDGKVDSTEAWALEVNSLDGSFPFVIDNASIRIDIDKDDLTNSSINGTPFNDTIEAYNNRLNQLSDSLETTSNTYRKRLVEKKNVDGMSEHIQALKDEIADLPFQFMKTNTDNPYGLVLFNNMLRRNTGDRGKLVEAYDQFPNRFKNSNLGKRISKSMPKIRHEYAIISLTHIGEIAPAFSAKSPQGKRISLDDVKGKATLIHFWSSWYKASRRENERLTKVYEKYHDNGLEIIGVSLDGSERQKNPRQDWKDAIKNDNLIWPQVSNLNYFKDTIAKTYNVKTLPASFLLDGEGKIIAKNLTGNSLENKLKELLNVE